MMFIYILHLNIYVGYISSTKKEWEQKKGFLGFWARESSSQEVFDEVFVVKVGWFAYRNRTSSTWVFWLAPTTVLEIITMRGGKICDILLDDNTAS